MSDRVLTHLPSDAGMDLCRFLCLIHLKHSSFSCVSSTQNCVCVCVRSVCFVRHSEKYMLLCLPSHPPSFPQIMAQGKGGAPGGPPTQVNKLDNMLGSLQSDLHKLGVQTVAKGVCGACCKPIVGQVRGTRAGSSRRWFLKLWNGFFFFFFYLPQVSRMMSILSLVCLTRWSLPWDVHGTPSISCARPVRRRSAPGTSFRGMASLTVGRTPTTCSPPASTTATAPS